MRDVLQSMYKTKCVVIVHNPLQFWVPAPQANENEVWDILR
jgi:hypothetical protein